MSALHAPTRLLLAFCVATVAVLAVALVDLDRMSGPALAHEASGLAAAVLLVTAALLRSHRWRLTGDAHDAWMAAGLLVLAVLCLPLEGVADRLVPAALLPVVGLGAHTAGTVLVLGLVHRAITSGSPDATGTGRFGAGLLAWAVAGLSASAALSVVLIGTGAGFGIAPVTVELVLALAWLLLGLEAGARDATQPWAGHVAPLLGSLGVVELLRAADRLQPGAWLLPATALLASVAMAVLHSSYVDLRAAARHHDPRPSPGLERGAQLLGMLDTWRPAATDVEVAGLVADLLTRRDATAQEVRLRGGDGTVHARSADLAAVLGELLDNALRHAPGSPVTLHVVQIGGRVEISVADRGPGLSSAAAERIMAALPQQRRGPDRISGLLAARTLLESDGGRLELRTRIGGATFVVTLPAAEQRPTGHPAHRPGWATA